MIPWCKRLRAFFIAGAIGFIIAGCGVDCIGVSASEDPDDTETKPLEYKETIEVNARRPDDPSGIIDLPAFVTTIEIDAQGTRFQTLPELLSGVVGVTIKDFGGLGNLSTVSIRGSAANQVLVLLDGMPLNTASDAGINLATLPLDAIEKVEVLRGADSAVYGSGAMGGVINLITRRAREAGWQTSGSLSMGSYDTLNLNTGLWHSLPHFDWRVIANYRRSVGDFPFRNNRGTEFNPDDDTIDRRENNAFDAIGLTTGFRLKPAQDQEFSGTFDGFYDDKGIPGMITFPSPHAKQKDRRITGILRYESVWPGETGYRLFAEASGKSIALDFDDPLGEQTGVPVTTRQRTRVLGGRMGLDVYHLAGSGGMTVHWEDERLDDTHFGVPDRTTVAVNLHHDLSVLNDSLWLTTMLRYDTISDADEHWSPKFGVRWFLTDRVSVRANAGIGFRAPSFNELFMEAGMIVGNADLVPEESVSYDLGITWEASRGHLEAAVFQIDSDDLIQYVLVSGFRYKPFNIGKARSRGFEIDGSYRVGAGFVLSGSYTWDEAMDESGEPNVDGKQIPGRPEHDVFARVAYEYDPVTVWSEWHYLSGNFVTRANTKELDDRNTGNLGISWNINQSITCGVEVKNILDDDVVDIRGFPLPPRSVMATVQVMR
ncbi:TonB-dependent receptor [bacterium]|nr:TonB-dependent receptor [candidate division CSSED10-310 bacterium]